MSRDAGEGVPPRRPRPESRRPAGPEPGPRPEPGPGGSGEEPSTWQPNPKRAKVARARPGAPGPVVAAPEVVPEQGGPGWWERIFFGRVGSGQLALYCRQFAAYSDAGV